MNASCSRFGQILKLIPRHDFELIVKGTRAEYRSKGLSSWSQFVGMLFCQLGRAHSLREIAGGWKRCEGKLIHLGITAPVRSSLSYANGHRPWELFEKVFSGLFETVAAKAQGNGKFRFKHRLVSLDSTTIDRCLSMCDWAKFRRTKGAVKLHVMLDHEGYLPCFGLITDGKVHDVRAAHQMDFPPKLGYLGPQCFRIFVTCYSEKTSMKLGFQAPSITLFVNPHGFPLRGLMGPYTGQRGDFDQYSSVELSSLDGRHP